MAFGLTNIAAAAQAPVAQARLTPGRRAIVPVLAEAGGASLHERLRGARVRVFALPAGGKGHRGSRRLVGSARTGSLGIALVQLKTRRAPRHIAVVVGGGRLLGKRFGGHMKGLFSYRGHHAVYISPLSSLVAGFKADHPHKSLKLARRAVRRSLRIPGFFDFAGDLADRRLFNGGAFIKRARANGGFDRYLARRARRLAPRAAPLALAASVDPTASGNCWKQAAQTTAGMAELMGFTGVPSPPALPSCHPAAQPSEARASAVAHASAIPGLEVFGILTSLASLIYGVASGQKAASQVAEVQAQLNEVQVELREIQAELGGLQTQVAAVNTNVLNGDETALTADARPIITSIKTASSDTMVLLGAASQILCRPGAGCALPAGATNLGEALNLACDVKPESAECKAFYSDLYFTSVSFEGDRPLKAVENLGADSLGSAFSGGPAEPGIVQYALEGGAEDRSFFTTEDAADARLQWAYYTLYPALAQTTYATVLSMGIGQPLPGAQSKHPPSLTAEEVEEHVDELNPPISLSIAAFPNMPDTAVIDTNDEAADKDPPFMFPQQVGAIASQTAYQVAAEYELSRGDVSSGSITSTSGPQSLTTLQQSGEPPLAMTPAAANGETWQLLPSGGRRAPLPAITSASFPDWRPAGAEAQIPLPEWNASTKKVEATQGGLIGPLADLYSGAAPVGGQTAGQWMTSNSGIESKLLMPQASGYETPAASGIVAFPANVSADPSEPGLDFISCAPGGDDECLLPTWQSLSINPYLQTSSGQSYNAGSSQINTGLFDFNTGLVIANQQGHTANESQGFHESLPTNSGTFLNQYPNWSRSAEVRHVAFPGFLEALNGSNPGALQAPSVNAAGRPILFTRVQAANDCFYWTGSTGANSADGTGCLAKRNTSGKILP
jgi:hypothetical protein